MKTATRRYPQLPTRRRGGFTLIEMMVTIGILILLASLLTPLVMTARKNAGRTKLASDLSVIGLALEEYKRDHGEYPPVNQPNTGFAVLGRALLGTYGDGVINGSPPPPPPPDPDDPPTYDAGKPYLAGDCVQTGPGTTYAAIRDNVNVPVTDVTNMQAWVPFAANDMEDGFGSRLRAGGKKTAPYIQPERFRVRGCGLLDADGKPILYFVAKSAKPNLTQMLPGNNASFISYTNNSLFNVNNNLIFFKRPFTLDIDDNRARARFAAVLGDVNDNGIIDPGESARSSGPFLLWAAGPDGFYGPVNSPSTNPLTLKEINKCDDVTNFRE